MQLKQLVLGQQYKTKIGREWQLVTLTSLRENLAAMGTAATQVLVRTGAGNVIYRTPGQLRKP